MEYSKTFKNGQGTELEMKVKAECPTEESVREALSFITQSSHKFYLDVTKVCKEEMEAGKTPRKGIASKEPDFVWGPDIKLEGAVEDSCTMSQEEFGQMLQHWRESTPRCIFVEESSSNSTGESLTAEGMKSQENKNAKKHPHKTLMDLSMKVAPLLAEAALEILKINTQSEYAVKYENVYPLTKGYDELVSNAAKEIRNGRVNNADRS